MAQHIWSFEPDSLSGTLPTPGLVGSSSIRQRRYWAYCCDVAAQTATLITLFAAFLSTTILGLPFPLLHWTQKLPAGSGFDRLVSIPSRNPARRALWILSGRKKQNKRRPQHHSGSQSRAVVFAESSFKLPCKPWWVKRERKREKRNSRNVRSKWGFEAKWNEKRHRWARNDWVEKCWWWWSVCAASKRPSIGRGAAIC